MKENTYKIMEHYSSLLSIDNLTNDDINFILKLAKVIQKNPTRFSTMCSSKILSLLFYEASTRTYFSFSSAMQRLGGGVIGFPQAESTSVSKGETLEDTARMMASYSDIMVVRNSEIGSLQRVANAVNLPVINGGEGSAEHPTQTLCDLYTISEYFKNLNVSIGFYGDLKFGRTNHSLMKAASRFGANFICIAPEELQMPEIYIHEAKQNGSSVITSNSIKNYLGDIDVLYVSRLQKERLPQELSYEKLKKEMVVTKELVASLKKTSIIMHPLPRAGEIEAAVDYDVRAKYFEQAANGVPVRMAIMLLSFQEIRHALLSDSALLHEIESSNLFKDGK